jgi:hypothetical protein
MAASDSLHSRSLSHSTTRYSLRCIPILLTLVLPQQFSYNFWTPNSNSQSQSQSHITTDGQSVLVSSPVWGSWPDIYFRMKVAVLSIWGALSDERTGPSFPILSNPPATDRLSLYSLGLDPVKNMCHVLSRTRVYWFGTYQWMSFYCWELTSGMCL